MYVSCVILGWRPQVFTNISEDGFVATEASRGNCGPVFYASESFLRALCGACGFILQCAILRHEVAKQFQAPENTRLETAFLTMHFPFRFKHFSGSGMLLRIFLESKSFQGKFKDLPVHMLPERVASWFFMHLKGGAVGFPVHMVSSRSSQYCWAKWENGSEHISGIQFWIHYGTKITT